MASSLQSLPPLAAGHSRLYLCRHGETDSNAQSLLQVCTHVSYFSRLLLPLYLLRPTSHVTASLLTASYLYFLQGSGVDAVLKDVGKAQAASLAESLACIRLDLVASSTLARCVHPTSSLYILPDLTT